MAIKVRYPEIKNTAELARAGVVFPASVTCEGTTYYRTGKIGTHRATGRPTAEYSHKDMGEDRCWAFSDGTIAEAHS